MPIASLIKRREYVRAYHRKRKGILPIKDLALRKNDYRHLLVDYPGAPTGKAFVGINKTPFMKTDTGIGFRGVLLQDENREKVQCYECGDWLMIISSSHLRFCTKGKMTSTHTYKKKHGLFLSKGLGSDVHALQMTKNLKDSRPKIQTEQQKKGLVKMLKHGRNTAHLKTDAYKNKYGTCDLQILSRLVRFVLSAHELPGPHNIGRGIAKVLCNRFGTVSKGLAELGLPERRRQGTNMYFKFPDGSEFDYNINQWNDREALYQMMLEKCPVLTTNDLEKFLPKKEKI